MANIHQRGEGSLVNSMRLDPRKKTFLEIIVLLFLLFLAVPAAVEVVHAGERQKSEPTERQIQIPNRPSTPLFEGTQGKQKSEIHFDPATRIVTIKFSVQDPNGYFIPNLRRDNFVVYENGARQQNVTVEIEHASVSLGVLVEFGGRTQALNKLMAMEVARAGRQLQDVLAHDDKVAVWKYSDKVEKIKDFSQGDKTLDEIFDDLGEPQFSETNLYDAVIAVVQQMKAVKGRKAIVLISSGIDTFSKAKFDDALDAARTSDTPIYVIALTQVLRDLVDMNANTGALAHVDWEKADRQLQAIARASGGRAYSAASTIDLAAIYDDMMENLRVRYVIRYRSSNNLDLNSPRTVRVELVDPKTGGPLQIVDQNGRVVRANVIVQDTYVPDSAAAKP